MRSWVPIGVAIVIVVVLISSTIVATTYLNTSTQTAQSSSSSSSSLSTSSNKVSSSSSLTAGSSSSTPQTTSSSSSTTSSSSSQHQEQTITTTSSLTTITAPKPSPQLVKANGYYLSTPLEMMNINDSVFQSFEQHLITANVSYLYFNLPNMNLNGSLTDNFTLDTELILRFDQYKGSHNFQYIAWTGSEINPQSIIGNFTSTGLDQLASSVYRAGFDGILIDLEPVPNDSPQFLTMLSDLRHAISQNNTKLLLGANSMKIDPSAVSGQDWSWDPSYFSQVSSTLDYISPMFFESGTNTQQEFIHYVDNQLNLTSHYVKSPVLFAIPNWYSNTTWHHPWAENLSNSIIAIRAYIDSVGSNKKPLPTMLGIGIYGLNKTFIVGEGTPAEALETTPHDWATFQTQWVNTAYPQELGTSLH